MTSVFLAGASGVIGAGLLPILVQTGHRVAGMTRSPEKLVWLRQLGCEPIVCDVFDRTSLFEAVAAFGPEVVVHQLTDLPDKIASLADFWERNNRIRTEGTRNLVDAALAAGARHVIAQSIAWELPNEADNQVVLEHEQMVLDAGGVVVRYGQFYGPGTFHQSQPPPPPRVEIARAARETAMLLEAPSGVVVVAE